MLTWNAFHCLPLRGSSTAPYEGVLHFSSKFLTNIKSKGNGYGIGEQAKVYDRQNDRDTKKAIIMSYHI